MSICLRVRGFFYSRRSRPELFRARCAEVVTVNKWSEGQLTAQRISVTTLLVFRMLPGAEASIFWTWFSVCYLLWLHCSGILICVRHYSQTCCLLFSLGSWTQGVVRAVVAVLCLLSLNPAYAFFETQYKNGMENMVHTKLGAFLIEKNQYQEAEQYQISGSMSQLGPTFLWSVPYRGCSCTWGTLVRYTQSHCMITNEKRI